VTRLGEFSPIGRSLILGSFCKIAEVVRILGLLFPWYKLCINFYKKWVGLYFGRFKKNSSGHPGGEGNSSNKSESTFFSNRLF
jgi:hypothetical protein